MEIFLELVISFCDEASDLLNRWEQICLQMKKQVDPQLWQEMFRIAHNIKGGSRAVGLADFGDFIHKIEDGITLLRDGQVQTTEHVISSLLEVHGILMDWIEHARENPQYLPELTACLERFQGLMQSNGAATSASANTQHEKSSSESEASTDALPSLEELVAQVEAENASKVEPNTEMPLTVAKVASTSNSKSPSKVSSKTAKKTSIGQNETIRISAQKLDLLIQTIGELSIHQSIALHTKNQTSSEQQKAFSNSLLLGQKLTKELYEKALSLRMQSLSSVFQRLERNIVDIAQALNKNVEVIVEGGEVELDKTVIEKIIDPLTHIVRNAVDHGIELPDKRKEAGKEEVGHITISAQQDTFGVLLIIKDDGKGLIPEKIFNKAVEKKLVAPNAKLTDSEILNLIFLPGFSTAEKITDVSGRGVGMDVVSKALYDLSGTIRIQSEPGKGSSFIITLPTSVNIIDGMVVSLAGQNYVIPVGAVEEVINSKRQNLDSTGTMIKLRNQVVPIYDLGRALKHSKELDKAERKAMLICRFENEKLAFQVDRVIGQQQIVIRPLNDNINGVFGLLGGTILGNGEPGLIIDIPAITEHYISLTQRKKEVAA